MTGRRHLTLLILAFALTRIYLVWAAHLPVNVEHSGDVEIYGFWGSAIDDDGYGPYVGVPIEYPPGVLPAITAPAVLSSDEQGYRDWFVILMLAVDMAAFAGLLRASAATDIRAGPWLWIVATAILGPIVYLRLDIIPAAATIWAIERLAARSWAGASGWLAFGAIAKIYPGFLLPATILGAPDRRKAVTRAAIVAGLLLVPYLTAIGDLWDTVFTFHAARGIQAESTWGLLYLAASRLEGGILLDKTFGSVHVGSTMVSATKLVSTGLSLAVVAAGAFLAARRLRRADPAVNAQLLFGMLALLLAFGTVFSPQFVLWLIALGAGAMCFRVTARWPMIAIIPIAALTQFVFPFRIERLHVADYTALIPLGVRNVLVFAVGLGAILALDWQPRRREGPTPEPRVARTGVS